MNNILFSPEAVDDLQQIKTYIAEELLNYASAIKTIAKIIERIQILSRFPEAGFLLSSVTNIISEYRVLICGDYNGRQ